MTAEQIRALQKVDIDTNKFKYVLIKAHSSEDNVEPVYIVRGYIRAAYHCDVFDEVQALHPDIDMEPVGGGRIIHESEKKTIHIFGYSQAYGKADHTIAAELLKKEYPDYKITVSDEGY